LSIRGAATVCRITPFGAVLWERIFQAGFGTVPNLDPSIGGTSNLRSQFPAVAEDGRLFIMVGTKMAAVAPDTGETLWATAIDSNPEGTLVDNDPANDLGDLARHTHSPVPYQDRVYVLDADSELVVLDANTGAVIAQNPVEGYSSRCSLIVTNDGIPVQHVNRGILLRGTRGLDPMTGKPLWISKREPYWSCCVVAPDGRFAGGSENPFILKNGKQLWSPLAWYDDIGWASPTGDPVPVTTVSWGSVWTISGHFLMSNEAKHRPYVLFSSDGETLAAPTDKVSMKKPGLIPEPPPVVPKPGQYVYSSYHFTEGDSPHMSQFLHSIAAPVNIPEPNSWSTAHRDQQNTRRIP